MRFPPPRTAVCLSWLLFTRVIVNSFLLSPEGSVALPAAVPASCTSRSCVSFYARKGTAASQPLRPTLQPSKFTSLPRASIPSSPHSPSTQASPACSGPNSEAKPRCAQQKRIPESVPEPWLFSSVFQRPDGGRGTTTTGKPRRLASGAHTPERSTLGYFPGPTPGLRRQTRSLSTHQDRHFSYSPPLLNLSSACGFFGRCQSPHSSARCLPTMSDKRSSLAFSAAPREVRSHTTFGCTCTRNETRRDRGTGSPARCIFRTSFSSVSLAFASLPYCVPFSSSPQVRRSRSTIRASSVIFPSGRESKKATWRQLHSESSCRLPAWMSRRSPHQPVTAAGRDRRLPSESFDQLKRLLEAKQYEVKLLLEKHADLLDPLALRQAYVHHTLNSKLAERMRIQGDKSKLLHERIREMQSRRWRSVQQAPRPTEPSADSPSTSDTNSREYYDEEPPMDPQAALREADIPHRMSVACDLKRRSCTNLSVNPRRLSYAKAGHVAVECASAGADIILVNTNKEGWGGSYEDLGDACQSLRGAFSWAERPAVVMKDIIIHPIQIAQAVEAKADGVYLHFSIVCKELEELLFACTSMGTQALVEVHDAVEARQAEDAGATLFVVNNWDRFSGQLSSSLEHALDVRSVLSAEVMALVSGGVCSLDQMIKYAKSGFDGIVMGQVLTRPGALELIKDAKAWQGPPRELLHLFAPTPLAAGAAAAPGFLPTIDESQEEVRAGRHNRISVSKTQADSESPSSLGVSVSDGVPRQPISSSHAGLCDDDGSRTSSSLDRRDSYNGNDRPFVSLRPVSEDEKRKSRPQTSSALKQRQAQREQRGPCYTVSTRRADAASNGLDEDLDIATKVYEELKRGWVGGSPSAEQGGGDAGESEAYRTARRGRTEEGEGKNEAASGLRPRHEDRKQNESVTLEQRLDEKAPSVLRAEGGGGGNMAAQQQPKLLSLDVEDVRKAPIQRTPSSSGRDREHRDDVSSAPKQRQTQHEAAPAFTERIVRQSGPDFQPRCRDGGFMQSSVSPLLGGTPGHSQQGREVSLSSSAPSQHPPERKISFSSSLSRPKVLPGSRSKPPLSAQLPPVSGVTEITRDSDGDAVDDDEEASSYRTGPVHSFASAESTCPTKRKTDSAGGSCSKHNGHPEKSSNSEPYSDPKSESEWLRSFSRELLELIDREKQITQVCAEEQRDQQLAMFRRYKKLVGGLGQNNIKEAEPSMSLLLPPSSLNPDTYSDPLGIVEELKNDSTSIAKPFREAFPHEPARAAEACTAAAAAAIANPTAFASVAREHLQRAVDKGAYTIVKGSDAQAQLTAAAPTQEIAEAMAEATAAAVTADHGGKAICSVRGGKHEGVLSSRRHDIPSARTLAAAAADAINERRAKGVRPDLLAAPFVVSPPDANPLCLPGEKGSFQGGGPEVFNGSKHKQELREELTLSSPAFATGKSGNGMQLREYSTDLSAANNGSLEGKREMLGGRDRRQNDSSPAAEAGRQTSDGQVFDEVELQRVGRLFLTEDELRDFIHELREKKATRQSIEEQQHRSRHQPGHVNAEDSQVMVGPRSSASILPTCSVTSNCKEGNEYGAVSAPPQTSPAAASPNKVVRDSRPSCLKCRTETTEQSTRPPHVSPVTGSGGAGQSAGSISRIPTKREGHAESCAPATLQKGPGCSMKTNQPPLHDTSSGGRNPLLVAGEEPVSEGQRATGVSGNNGHHDSAAGRHDDGMSAVSTTSSPCATTAAPHSNLLRRVQPVSFTTEEWLAYSERRKREEEQHERRGMRGSLKSRCSSTTGTRRADGQDEETDTFSTSCNFEVRQGSGKNLSEDRGDSSGLLGERENASASLNKNNNPGLLSSLTSGGNRNRADADEAPCGGPHTEKVFTRFGRYQPGPPSVTPADQMEAYLPFFQGHRGTATHQPRAGSNRDEDSVNGESEEVRCNQYKESLSTSVKGRNGGTESNVNRVTDQLTATSDSITCGSMPDDSASSEFSSLLSGLPLTSLQAYKLLQQEEQRHRSAATLSAERETKLPPSSPSHVEVRTRREDLAAVKPPANTSSLSERVGGVPHLVSADNGKPPETRVESDSRVYPLVKAENRDGWTEEHGEERNDQAAHGNSDWGAPGAGTAGRAMEGQEEKTSWELLLSGPAGSSVAGGFLERHVRDLASSGGIEVEAEEEG